MFAGQVLEKAAKGSISDIVRLISLIKNFGDQIPQSVKDCLDGNAEFKALGLKYGIDDSTDPNVIEKKVIAYITLLPDRAQVARLAQRQLEGSQVLPSRLRCCRLRSLDSRPERPP